MGRAAWVRVAAAWAAASLCPPAAARWAMAAAAGEGPAPVSVEESRVASAPYPVRLSPDGELRILHFEAGLVGPVVVGQPWLLTVLIQGSDVILQAKASSGSTPLVVYVGDVATLWQVTIARHAPENPKITVTAGRPAAAGAKARGGEGPGPLESFLSSLSPEQRALYSAWERTPSAGALARFVASLSPDQRAEFDSLVRARLVVARPEPAPPLPALVDRTTVIHPAGDDGAGAPRVSVLSSPAGLDVTASASVEGGALEVSYAVANRRDAPVAVSRVTVGGAAAAGGASPAEGDTLINPGAEGRGRVTVAHASGRVTVTIEFADGGRAVIAVDLPSTAPD